MDCPIRVHSAEEEEEEAEAANTNCSNPAEADNLFRIQRELDETKIMLMFNKQGEGNQLMLYNIVSIRRGVWVGYPMVALTPSVVKILGGTK